MGQWTVIYHGDDPPLQQARILLREDGEHWAWKPVWPKEIRGYHRCYRVVDQYAYIYAKAPFHWFLKARHWLSWHRWDFHIWAIRRGWLRLDEGGYYRDARPIWWSK